MGTLTFVKEGSTGIYKYRVYEGFGYEVTIREFYDSDIRTAISFNKLWHPMQPDITWHPESKTASFTLSCNYTIEECNSVKTCVDEARDLVIYLNQNYQKLVKRESE